MSTDPKPNPPIQPDPNNPSPFPVPPQPTPATKQPVPLDGQIEELKRVGTL